MPLQNRNLPLVRRFKFEITLQTISKSWVFPGEKPKTSVLSRELVSRDLKTLSNRAFEGFEICHFRMGVGGKFWELLKPCARFEGVEFLRDKRVAVDLSFWVIQHDSAARNSSSLRSPRNPHLRITFFRTINLFAKVSFFFIFLSIR